MEKDPKKQFKARAKAEKKRAKAQQKQLEENLKTTYAPTPPTAEPTDKPSPALRFAEAVRGVIYLIFAVSLIFAVILREKGVLVFAEALSR